MNESQLLTEVAAIHERRTQAKLVKAERELAEAQKAGGERVFFGDKESGGAVAMMMHPTHKHVIGQTYGYDALQDPGVLRDYQKQFPAARVRSRPPSPVFRMLARPWSAPADRTQDMTPLRGFRFRKTYR